MKALLIIFTYLCCIVCTTTVAQNKVKWSIGMDMGGGRYWLSNKTILETPIQIHICPCREVDLTKFFINRNIFQLSTHLGINYKKLVGISEISFQRNASFFLGFNEKSYSLPEYYDDQYNVSCPTCNYTSPDIKSQKLLQLSILQWLGYKFNFNTKLQLIFKIGLKYNINNSFKYLEDNFGWASGCIFQKEFTKNFRLYARIVYDNLTLVKFKELMWLRSAYSAKSMLGFTYILGS